jgi:hypothetical protein
MDLVKKFQEATCNNTVRISELEIDRRYPIIQARHIDTKYGSTILLSIKSEGGNTIKVFLPKRYGAVFSEQDLTSINSHNISLHLVYKGMSDKAYILGIEK